MPERSGGIPLADILHFWTGSDYAPLPDWARFYIELGRALVTHNGSVARRIIAAVASPTRAYAAAFCAVGAVSARCGVPVGVDAETHFNRLASLPPRTTVMCRDGPKKKRQGWLKGVVCEGDERFLIVQLQAKGSGGLTFKIPARQSLEIEISEERLASLPWRVISKSVRDKPGLMSGILEATAFGDFARQSRLEFAIVGSESSLREEITRAPFATCSPENGPIEGRLQDLLRVRQWLGPDRCYRGDVYSTAGFDESRASDTSPPLIIFDGAGGFLKWQQVWPRGHWIIVLDLTDPRSDMAATEINRLYVSAREDCMEFADAPQAVAGVECSLFEVRLR